MVKNNITIYNYIKLLFTDGWLKPDEKGGIYYGKHLCKI